jgi:dihydroflavonol-4-reductase
MKILVTGASGFLGNNLVRRFREDNHQVVTTVRPTSDLRPLDGLDVETVHASLTDPVAMAPVVEDVDLIVHAAAMIQLGLSKRKQSIAFNVGSTETLAQAARRRGIRMIHVSSVDTFPAAIDGVPVNEKTPGEMKFDCSYVASKRASGESFQNEVKLGLDGVTVCPGFMIGPNDWKPSSGEMLLMIARTPLFFAPAGGCSAVDVRDVAEGIVAAVQHGRSGEKYILGGENVSYFDLWCRMAKVVGCWPPRRKMRNWLAHTAGRVGDFLSRFSKEELAVNSAALRMGQMHNWYSSDKAAAELGYKIGDVDVAIEDSWNWFKAHDYV